MEPSPQREFDATSVKPDGYITVVYFGDEPSATYCFEDIKHWHWRRDPEQGNQLVVIFNSNDRHEIPAVSIKTVKVKSNNERFHLAQRYLESLEEITTLEAKLQWKRAQAARQKEAMLQWHGTS